MRASPQASGASRNRVGSTGAIRTDGGGMSRSSSNLYNLQAIVESRKNSFSAPDEVLLERKGSADSQGVFLLDRSSSTVEGHSHGPWSYTDRSPDNGQHPSRSASDRYAAAPLATSTSPYRGTSRLAAELKIPDWLSPAHTRRPSLQGDADARSTVTSPEQQPEALFSRAFEADTTATLAHLDHQQAEVTGSLQQLHLKLETVAKALGIPVSEQHTQADLILAHHGSAQHEREEVQRHVSSLISQVDATLQQPSAASKRSATDSSSISTAVQRQLDAVTEQLASQGSAAHKHAGSAQLSDGVSDVIKQLRLAEQATTSAHALASCSTHQQQEFALMPEHLNTASRAISAAISSSNQLQQQLRTQTINQPSDQVIRQPANRNSEQMHSLIDNLLQGTYSALRQEFQTTVLYKGSEVEHVIKSVMRKQVIAGQQALADLTSPSDSHSDRLHH